MGDEYQKIDCRWASWQASLAVPVLRPCLAQSTTRPTTAIVLLSPAAPPGGAHCMSLHSTGTERVHRGHLRRAARRLPTRHHEHEQQQRNDRGQRDRIGGADAVKAGAIRRTAKN